MGDCALRCPGWWFQAAWGQTALVELLGGEVDFSVDGFEMDLEVELTLELVNVKGFLFFFGGGGGGRGAERTY